MAEITVNAQGDTYTYEVKEMPHDVFDWQCSARLENLTALRDGKMFNGFGPHLPTMSVVNAEGDFPINSAAKGVGLVPKPEYIEEYTIRFEEMIHKSLGLSWVKSLPQRLDLLIDLYSQAEHIDKTSFGSLEIYAKRTLAGVRLDPRVSLLFVDLTKKNLSYDMRVIAELHEPQTPIHRFETAVHDLFHVPGGKGKVYPFAYLFRIIEIYDKTPGPRASMRLI